VLDRLNGIGRRDGVMARLVGLDPRDQHIEPVRFRRAGAQSKSASISSSTAS
jgi:hypothetical protein